MQVTYNQIAVALEGHGNFEDVLQLFDAVQAVTHCSTGCGGCHNKVLEVISEIMMG
jgi:NAD(P)H-nitrite reductase large subunit